MAKTIYFIDGKFKRKPLSSIEDRGFFFADSIYEVIRGIHEKPVFLKEHLDRLYRGLKEIKIPFETSRDELTEIIYKSLKKLKKT